MTDEPTEFSIALETTPAPEPELSVELAIVGVVEEFLHLSIPDAAKVDLIAALQPHLDRAGDERAGAALAYMAGRLENTAAGEALRRVIGGNAEAERFAVAMGGLAQTASKLFETESNDNQQKDDLRRQAFDWHDELRSAIYDL